MKGPNIKSNLNEQQVKVWLHDFITRDYIIQKYVDSVTLKDIPFDVRIHIRRGKEAKWNIINIYVRIGNGNEKNVTSNISQGGSVSKLTPFLKNTFPDQWKEIKQKLHNLAKEFPPYFQRNYTELIDAIGLDIGIDRTGRLWLFEVNSYPGSTSFELKSQIVAMEYAKYLALHKREVE